ncbi:MAG: DHH family phosphoesterase, partial [Euryarchaeota archaeon]|nr:DHH family phosphoesterase [Euryarchaeota archaeon]
MEQLLKRARECAHAIEKQDEILIVSHVDADGLASAGIICGALDRIEKGYEVKIVKQLDPSVFLDISSAEAVIFTDLGSGSLDLIDDLGPLCVIADHHQPAGRSDTALHLNPHLFGFNGATDLSGSGATYLIARALGENADLADLAVVGAVGDLQHVREGRLRGVNRLILDEAEKHAVVAAEKDLQAFGRQTRPIHKLLEYASNPYIPGITGNSDQILGFLTSLNIELKEGGKWKKWIDLSSIERRTIISALIQRCLAQGMPPEIIQNLVGEVYTLLKEERGTALRDASEYATLLNATARYGFEKIGVAVCMGDREGSYRKANELLLVHRENLARGLNYVKQSGVTTLSNLQYFHAGDNILETIVGIVAGMCKNLDGVNRHLPIVGLANSEEGVKVSARGTQTLVQRRLNLARAMSEAANSVGGVGGGHDIAAGATIPEGTETEFLKHLNQLVGL